MVCCHSDNQAVVAALNGGYCREKLMAHLLRCLFFLEAKHELSLTAVHVRGVDNVRRQGHRLLDHNLDCP